MWRKNSSIRKRLEKKQSWSQISISFQEKMFSSKNSEQIMQLKYANFMKIIYCRAISSTICREKKALLSNVANGFPPRRHNVAPFYRCELTGRDHFKCKPLMTFSKSYYEKVRTYRWIEFQFDDPFRLAHRIWSLLRFYLFLGARLRNGAVSLILLLVLQTDSFFFRVVTDQQFVLGADRLVNTLITLHYFNQIQKCSANG